MGRAAAGAATPAAAAGTGEIDAPLLGATGATSVRWWRLVPAVVYLVPLVGLS